MSGTAVAYFVTPGIQLVTPEERAIQRTAWLGKAGIVQSQVKRADPVSRLEQHEHGTESEKAT